MGEFLLEGHFSLPRLITEDKDYDNNVGIGWHFFLNGKSGRIATLMRKNDFNWENFKKAAVNMEKEMDKGEKSRHIMWGNRMLKGNEIIFEEITD